jgi:hypothetical protein
MTRSSAVPPPAPLPLHRLVHSPPAPWELLSRCACSTLFGITDSFTRSRHMRDVAFAQPREELRIGAAQVLRSAKHWPGTKTSPIMTTRVHIRWNQPRQHRMLHAAPSHPSMESQRDYRSGRSRRARRRSPLKKSAYAASAASYESAGKVGSVWIDRGIVMRCRLDDWLG